MTAGVTGSRLAMNSEVGGRVMSWRWRAVRTRAEVRFSRSDLAEAISRFFFSTKSTLGGPPVRREEWCWERVWEADILK